MTLWEAVVGILRGILQYALYLIPLVRTLPEASQPPAWWYRYWGYYAWVNNLDDENRPNETWVRKWLHACFFELEREAVDAAAQYSDTLADALRGLFGWLPSKFVSFSSWISTIETLVGIYKPSWALNAMNGLVKLYNWLPPEIRNYVQTWTSLFDSIVDLAKAWAMSYYGTTVARVVQIWNWFLSNAYALSQWWLSARGILDQFRSNPYGFIAARLGAGWVWLLAFRNNPSSWVQSWLGSTWVALVSFRNGPLEFYFNLWGAFGAMMGEFFSNPLEFLYSRAEDFLNEKMG